MLPDAQSGWSRQLEAVVGDTRDGHRSAPTHMTISG